MKEKKLTDEEIVKALANCVNGKYLTKCKNCHYYEVERGCQGMDIDLLDLIHRLQDENERLTDTLNQYINGELINAETMGKIISLEKQVDELKAENKKLRYLADECMKWRREYCNTNAIGVEVER